MQLVHKMEHNVFLVWSVSVKSRVFLVTMNDSICYLPYNASIVPVVGLACPEIVLADFDAPVRNTKKQE